MNKIKRNLILISILSMLGSLAPRALADDGDSQADSFACADSANVMDCIEKTKQNPPPQPESPPEIMPLNDVQWTSSGPLGLGIRYDNDLGWIPEASYVQMFYDNGINLQFGYGANEQRANITLGHSFSANQQVKITYEYLAQNLPFDFASGSVNEWVNQNAFGAAYRYLIFNQLLHSIDVNGYYIHANNKNLSDVIFYQDNIAKLNLRHIAGGTEETVTTGVTLNPLQRLLINLGGGYSHLVYDTEYEDNQETATLAYNAGLDFLITTHTKLSAGITNSAAETDSNIKISQILPARIEAAITGQYSQGQAGQPNSSSITIGFSYPVTPYTLVSADLGSLKSWVQKPVIRAPRVLAIKDEQVKQYSITAANPPAQSVQTGQMIQEIHTQDIFNFDPSLYDKVEYSLSMVNSDNLNSPQTQLYIDVKPDNGSVYNSIIYSTAPIPNSATPTGGTNTYHVIITALGYKNGLAQPVESQADLELDVNFNKNNEPQWNPNKTTGTIGFDQTNTASAINLNSYLASTVTQEGVKFSFSGSYPNWDLKTDSSGVWYLVRKADSTGAFDAGDISSTQPIPVILLVKYADDPEGATGTLQTLNITVNPDSKILFTWKGTTACEINNGASLPAFQPSNTNQYQLMLMATDPSQSCTQYTDGNGNQIKVKNDTVTYSIKTNNYPNTVNLSGNTLSVNGPTGGMGSQYSVDLNIKSNAQGNTDKALTALGVTVSKTLDLNTQSNINSVTHTFPYSGTYITTVVMSLDSVNTYQLTAASNTTNMMACPGSIASASDYQSCVDNKSVVSLPGLPATLPKPDSSGKVSLMWWSTSATPMVNSLTVAAN